MNPPRPVLIDTDPGIDDAMAIAVALAMPSLQVVGLTTVFGNHRIEVTTANAQRVLDHLGHPDIPVVAGAAAPLLREPSAPATVVHGSDGLGDSDLPGPSRPPEQGRWAAHHICETATASRGALTVVTLGPLTNLALAVRMEPSLPTLLRQVVVMGGAIRAPGNVTPTSEANIWNDPHAAEVVLQSGFALAMIGLDVTRSLVADRAWIDGLARSDSAGAQLVARTVPTYLEYHRSAEGIDGVQCHDVATIAYLLAPELFRVERVGVRTVTSGDDAGATLVADGRRGADQTTRPPVDVAVEVEVDAVLDLVRSALVG